MDLFQILRLFSFFIKPIFDATGQACVQLLDNRTSIVFIYIFNSCAYKAATILFFKNINFFDPSKEKVYFVTKSKPYNPNSSTGLLINRKCALLI